MNPLGISEDQAEKIAADNGVTVSTVKSIGFALLKVDTENRSKEDGSKMILAPDSTNGPFQSPSS